MYMYINAVLIGNILLYSHNMSDMYVQSCTVHRVLDIHVLLSIIMHSKIIILFFSKFPVSKFVRRFQKMKGRILYGTAWQ